MWIDSHCHLNHLKIRPLGAVSEIVQSARVAGVTGMVNICCRMADEFPVILETAEMFDDVWCTVGTHPHEASRRDEKNLNVHDIIKLARHPKVIGIGESGLDYYYEYSTKEDQEISFRKHIEACVTTDLPLVVHARDADEDIARTLREEGAGGALKGVMHCFSSGPALADAALEMGFYISFSGILTFKQAEELREIARRVPIDKLLVETDAPFLAPEPYRGKTNQPAYVAHTGAVLAELHGMAPEQMAAQTSKNFYSLFTKAKA
jgi:TatD DNase family protein